MQGLDSKITTQSLYKAFELMKDNKLDEAEKVLAEGLKRIKEEDSVLAGVYQSAYGVLYKLRKDFRKAWKYYEQAERLIPEDPALKIISARLLVEYFGQYDTVIRKMDRVAKMVAGNVPFVHQALCIKGVALLRKGSKKKAAECLRQSMGDHFKGMETAANVDFRLLEECVRKKVDLPLCREYLEEAGKLALKTKETVHQTVIKRLLTSVPQ